MQLSFDEMPSFDHSLFDKVIDWLYQNKTFSSNMLNDEPAINLINGINSVLQQALSNGITQEVPIELTTALEENVFIFSGFKTYKELVEMSNLLKDTSGGFKSFEKFKEDVMKIDNTYNRNYLSAEYNFAVQSTQMAVKWHDFEQNADEYNLQYRTAGDDKVRAEHQALDGTTLPMSDSFWNSYYPPLDWNCRCTVVEVIKTKYKTSDSKEAIKKGEFATNTPKKKIFRFNAGKLMKIYPPKHPYLQNNPKEVTKIIENLSKEQQKIDEMIKEMPANLTREEKIALAKNNIELEKALNISKGNPMSVEQADKQNANPHYGENSYYGINCQTCAPTYALRLRGFDVTAKPCLNDSKSKYLARDSKTFEIWKNPDGSNAQYRTTREWMEIKDYKRMTPKRYLEFFNEECQKEGVYELSINWNRRNGHATILQRFEDGTLRYIEPQKDNSIDNILNIDYLCNNGSAQPGFYSGIIRIDNKVFDIKFADILSK